MTRMNRVRSVAAIVGVALSCAVQAAPVFVNGLGVGGWESGDTRPAAGGAASPAQIDAQIKFLGEGVVVQDAAGGTPDASPTGSAGGLGYVRLDGTSANGGKSDIGYLDANGIAAASDMLSSNFGVTYRAYTDPNPTIRTLGLGLAVSNGLSNCGSLGTAACYYTFSHVNPLVNPPGGPAMPDLWLTETIGASSGLFRLYGSAGGGAPGGAGPEMTLADWAADATWGFLLDSTAGYDLVRLNFNLGSSQRNSLVYVDWVETNVLNGGERIDFVSAAHGTVPEPGTLAIFGLALAGLAATRRRTSA